MLFISHRSTDKTAAEELKRRALEQGYTAEQLFLDCDPESGIAAGAEWERAIQGGLNRCHALVVVVTNQWRESKWCFAELVAAKTLGKPIFPVLFERCDVGPELGERQGVRVFEEGERAFERLWKSINDRGLGPHQTRPWPPDQGDSCPYPGLDSFSERFAPVFFGRESEAVAVLEQLNTMRDRGEPRLLMIVGGSGSGKSSLLRAGVLPRLGRNHDWFVMSTLRFGRTPNDDLSLFGVLAQELVAHFPSDSPAPPNWRDLRAKLECDDVDHAAREFFDVLQDLNLACGRRDATTLLPIDQFEELLSAATKPLAERFLRFIHRMSSRNNGRLLVIGTLRSDYLDVYERHTHSLQPPYLHTYRLPPFPWERVTDVIVQPAARVGVTFTNELLERLRLDAPTRDALPLLAFTLERLFRECATDKVIELAEYEALGGMTGAIAQAVAKILPAQLAAAPEQALRLSFVRHLVQVNEKDMFVRRPARWSQLPDAARPLLEKFIDERLLHSSGEGDERTVEVSHEALFRCWPTLVDWLNVSSRVLRWRRDIERDRKSSGRAWSGLTRAQLAVSRRWPQERPEELSEAERASIRQALFRERALYAIVTATIIMVSCLAAWSYYQKTLADHASHAAQVATESANGNLASIATTLTASGQRTWALGQPVEGLWQLHGGFAAFHRLQDSNSIRRSLLLMTSLTDQLGRLLHHPTRVNARFAPDGRHVFTGGQDGIVRMWNIESGDVIREFRHPMREFDHVGMARIAVSADGEWLLTMDAMSATLWETATGEMARSFRHADRDSLRDAIVHPDGKHVITCGWDPNAARMWSISTGAMVRQFMHERQGGETPYSVDSILLDPAGKQLLTASEDGLSRLWNVESGEPVHSFECTNTHPDMSRDGKFVVTARDNAAVLWDAANGTKLREFPHDSPVAFTQFNSSATALLCLGRDGLPCVWAIESGRLIRRLRYREMIRKASFAPEGNLLVSVADDGAQVWDLRMDKPLRVFSTSHSIVEASANSAVDSVLTANTVGDVRLWHLAGAQRIWQSPPDKRVSMIGTDSLRRRAVIITLPESDAKPSGRTHDLEIRDCRTSELIHSWKVSEAVYGAGISDDGTKVFIASSNAGYLRHAETGELIRTMAYPRQGSFDRIRVSFSPQGAEVVVKTSIGLHVFNIEDGKNVLASKHAPAVIDWNERQFVEESGDVAHLRDCDSQSSLRRVELPQYSTVRDFFPPRKQMLTWCADDVARLWNLTEPPGIVHEFPHNGTLRDARFSPGGQFIATSGPRVAKVWDANQGNLVCEVQHGSFHQDEVRLTEIDKDSRYLMTYMDSSSPDQPDSVALWTLASGEPVLEIKLKERSHDWYYDAFFGEHDATLFTWKGDGAQLWKLPEILPNDEALVTALMKVRTGYEPAPSGAVVRMSHESWLTQRRMLRARTTGACPGW